MSERSKTFIGLFILLGAAALGYFQWNERTALLLKANALNDESLNLTAQSETLKTDYDAIKVEVAANRETSLQELSVVFPTSEDLTTLTRLFDDFAVTNHFETNPFFISSITYDSSASSEDGQYRYVPIQMSLTTSKRNLNEFLEYIYTSGSLEAEVRLMSVEDMRIEYPSEYGGSYEVQLELRAYFSKEL